VAPIFFFPWFCFQSCVFLVLPVYSFNSSFLYTSHFPISFPNLKVCELARITPESSHCLQICNSNLYVG
jgi:hypothetical protein